MQINEFLDSVCEQIKYKPIIKEISEELEGHIEESKECYMEEGMNEKEAEEKAISKMGKAEEIGKKLNKIHKPKMNWQLLLLLIGLLEFGFLVSCADSTDRWILNFVVSILSVIPFILIYSFDYRKLQNCSNLTYMIATILLIHLIINYNYNAQIKVVALPLYVISFIGFIQNINSQNKMKIDYFEKHNINVNIVKVITLSAISLVLTAILSSITYMIVLALVYLIISTVKLLQTNKKKYIAILWGIPIVLAVLLISMQFGTPIGMYRMNRIVASFAPDIDPVGIGWEGMQQKAIINSANPFGKADNMSNTIEYFNQRTNYPFITVLANYGWIMSISMIAMVIAFCIRLIIDAVKIKDEYGKLLILGIACLFILRSAFCLLMNFNLGIKADFSIPFISYGKTNLVTDIMTLALAFSVYRRKDILLQHNKKCDTINEGGI